MSRIRRVLPLALGLVLGLWVLGCGGGGDDPVAETSSPDSTPDDVTSTTRGSPLDIAVTRDVPYHEDIPDMHPPLVDVYAPTAPGPWPVVVGLHGGDGHVQTKLTTEAMARAVAAEGVVVFAPSIGGSDPDPLYDAPEKMQAVLSEVPCVEAFAAEHAEEYGGDPDDVNVYGFSGGARAAGAVLWAGATPGPGCLATGPVPQLGTAVLFEGDWMLAPSWDDALDTGGVRFDEATVWDHLDEDLDTEVVIVIGTEPQGPIHRIPVGDVFSDADCGGSDDGWVPAGGTCRYLELRDPDGTLRRVMVDEGWLDDGMWDISETSRLLVDRLEAAGQEPVVVEVDGLNHASNDQERAALVGPIIVEHVLG